MDLEIKEYIQFMDFNSKKENLYLIERNAPTPEEKEILKDLPFQQGVLDFSALLGERVFKNREIEYKFKLFNTPYSQRKVVERRIKQKLMIHSKQKLYETHNPNYYWLGKCKSVEVDNDYKFNNLLVTIVFDCYPYIFGESSYFSDFFDNFDLDDDVANYTLYNVSGSLSFSLFNSGSVSVKPQVTTNAKLEITVNGDSFNFKPGTKQDYYLSLKPGENKVTVVGNGDVHFHWRKEVMA